MALRTILRASSRCVMSTGGGLRPMRCSAARSLAICPWRWLSEPLIIFSCACSSARRASVVVRSPSLFLMSVAVSSRRTLRLSRSAVMASTSPCKVLVRCLTFSSSRCLVSSDFLASSGVLGAGGLAGRASCWAASWEPAPGGRRTAGRRPGPRRQARRRAGTAVASQVSLASTSLFPPTKHARPCGQLRRRLRQLWRLVRCQLLARPGGTRFPGNRGRPSQLRFARAA